MASREDPHDPQAAQDLSWIEEVELQELASLQWDVPPLSWLSPEQQAQFQSQAETRRYLLGEKIWSTDSSGDQFFILSGKVRLREEGASKPLATLAEGDWFGDLQEFSASVKAIAASKEVIVGRWDSAFWSHVSSSQRQREQGRQGEQREQREVKYVPTTYDHTPQQVSGYPFVSSLNTGAACLTMVAQHLQIPGKLEWVQRQLRGQRPKHLVEAGEKLGLQLRRLKTSWSNLRQLSFPVLLQWQQDSWVVAYGVRKDRLLIANPLNP